MSKRQQLNLYIRQVQQRLRLGASLRGVAIVTLAALVATIILTLILNVYAFPAGGLAPARLVLLAILVAAVCFGLAVPLWRLNVRRSVGRVETAFPEFQQRLVTFSEKENSTGNSLEPQSEIFLELLAADTLKVADSDRARPEGLVPGRRLVWLLGAGIVCAGVLVWMIAARPGFMGYGASLLWTGPRNDVPPIYQIVVAPGDAAVRRWLDEPVDHVRDVRSMLLLKLALLDRRQRDSRPLIEAQRRRLVPVMAALDRARRATDGFERVLAEWRFTSSHATVEFLDSIERGAGATGPGAPAR